MTNGNFIESNQYMINQVSIAGLDEPLIQLFHGLDIHELKKLKFYQNYDEVNRSFCFDT